MEIFGKIYSKFDRVIFSRLARSHARELQSTHNLLNFYAKGVSTSLSYDFPKIKKKTLDYVSSNKVGDHIAEYKYCHSSLKPNIYASCYACMIRSLYDDLNTLSQDEKQEWASYFDSFQSPDDGLFYDPVLINQIYKTEDWWGARHLALQLITSYSALGSRPKYDFYFLEPFYDPRYIVEWLESRDWGERIAFTGNEVMNYGCLLQYSRDYFQNREAGVGLQAMMDWLEDRINPDTGMWGDLPTDNPYHISQIVQGAYHIYPLFFYDQHDLPSKHKAIDLLLRTQNPLGGFGITLNSSACEDLDSIDPLIRFSRDINYRKEYIDLALKRAFPAVLANMNDDGGFVFRRNEPFYYGHKEMYSGYNESSMFATWFRTLCLAYLESYLGFSENFNVQRMPGYEIRMEKQL
ncbi:hypothetical protein [Methanosarcina sp. 1.H.A.2.2]|uniref:hypothetical protein n=1 Tax=Methanosarcina sp. 1.H.A.2.2 TaxID=1483601 RepID=UPI0006223D6C|nr:hypothetical protein [Methanosarcina sp. 1.H.A.2.2]KKH47217.1 hypothetical protein EO93_06250 [Methanosarcina sp. 1.H.A.2.2]